MVGLFVFLGMLVLQLCLYCAAFPEVTIFLLFCNAMLFPFYGFEMLEPGLGAEQLAPYEFAYPLACFMRDYIAPLHPVLRLGFIALCVAAYYLLVKFVNIKGIYIFQIAGVLFVGYLAYLMATKGFELNLLWSILLTAVITIFASGLRYSVFNPLE